jgi:hypothetical protein
MGVCTLLAMLLLAILTEGAKHKALSLGGSVNINVDLNELLKDTFSLTAGALATFKTKNTPKGGIWKGGNSMGRVFSVYYHPTRWHRTSVNDVKGAWVAPGEIATTEESSKSLSVDTAKYETCCNYNKNFDTCNEVCGPD